MTDDSMPAPAPTSPSGTDTNSPQRARMRPPGHQTGLWFRGLYLFGASSALLSALTCSGGFCGMVSLLRALPWIMLVPFFRAADFTGLGLLFWPLLLASYWVNAWICYHVGRWIGHLVQDRE